MSTIERVFDASVAALVAVLIGCSSTGSSGRSGDWSRSFVDPFDRVWQAATATLAEDGYLVEEVDQARGRIRAESPGDRPFREVVLEIRVIERGELVKVSVQAGGGPIDSPADVGRLERAVEAFLAGLEERLRRARGEG